MEMIDRFGDSSIPAVFVTLNGGGELSECWHSVCLVGFARNGSFGGATSGELTVIDLCHAARDCAQEPTARKRIATSADVLPGSMECCLPEPPYG